MYSSVMKNLCEFFSCCSDCRKNKTKLSNHFIKLCAEEFGIFSPEYKLRYSICTSSKHTHKRAPSCNVEVRPAHLFHPLLPELLFRWSDNC